MDGIHDLGGMHGFGRIGSTDEPEPVFRQPWEARIFALTMAMGAHGLWTLDADRHGIERIAPERYLAMSYYERWLAGLERLTAERKLEQLPGREHTSDPGADVLANIIAGAPSARPAEVAMIFQLGEKVRARNVHPPGHTRLPRYVRGRIGTIERLHGAHVLPDTNAHGGGEHPEPLYGVRFAAEELWGAEWATAGDVVHLDLWQSYLEPA